MFQYCVKRLKFPTFMLTSKEDLASVGNTKRPTCCVLVQTKPSKGEIPKEEHEK
ncbi:H/ACA ribonucleoprotein complex subunit 2-like protein [Linum perenne]